MFLVRCLVIGVAGGKHHAFDAQLHHFVEKSADALGVGAVEQCRVCGDAEALLNRFANALDGQLIAALAANREIVVFFLPVHVHRERQILAGLEKM